MFGRVVTSKFSQFRNVEQKNNYSTNAKKNIYELRTYTVQPSSYLPFLELTNKYINLRTVHSKLIGYWISEIGGVNEVFHLWEYESLDQRQQVRNALVGDKVWQQEYMVPMRTMLQKQENSLLLSLTDEVKENDKKGSIYELISVQNGEWGNTLQAYQELDVTQIGHFSTIIGANHHSKVALYQHDGLKSVDRVNEKRRGQLENANKPLSINSKIGFPTPFSPLK